MDAPGWRIGRVAGVPVYVARSWLLIAALVIALFGPGLAATFPQLGALAYGIAALYAVALLGSVLLHEVAHAVAAQRVGLPPQHIVITLWGGHTQFATQAVSPGRSLLVAAVGPAANGVLAVVVWLLVQALPVTGVGYRVLLSLAITNAFVAVFNLVPGLPLDGGRMLEAVIWKVTGRRHTGTIAAAWVGRLVAVGVLLYALAPVLTGGTPRLLLVVWAAMIGGMLWTAAGQALKAAEVDRRALAVSLPALMQTAVLVPSTASLARALAAAGGRAVVLASEEGQLLGVLDPVAAAQVGPERLDEVAVGSVARRVDGGAVLDVGLRGEALLTALRARPDTDTYVVVDRGVVVGVLPVRTVVAALTGARP